MKNRQLEKLTQEGKHLFSTLAKAYQYNGIDLVMTDVAPQRGGILSEAVEEGATAYIAGGKDGQKFFSNIPQYTLPYDTFTTRGEDTVASIVGCLPKGLCKDKVGLFLYAPLGDRLWGKTVESHTGSQIVATNEQNFRSYFEEKTNLSDILKAAGLTSHIIPSKVIRHNKPLSTEQVESLYETYASQEGKIVVQYCGEGCNEKGGGYSTRVVGSLDEFKDVCAEPRDSYIKVAKFISGCNSNLSICAGNLVPAPDMLGAVKNNLTEDESRFSGSTIYSLLHRARQMGINENNLVVSVQPATLKVVGDPQLTSVETNGVGNQLNYNFEQNILDSIYDIGSKLGTLMAMCGKVGLCGADLIITKEGEIFVNEINDRQQGPTESAGLNNEVYGLPALHRTAFLLNFADLKNEQVSNYLSEVGSCSREIYDQALQIPSPFYIKFISKYNGVAKQDLRAGNYALQKDAFGSWSWNLSTPQPTIEDLPMVDLTQNQTTVHINAVSMNKGDFFPKETQLLRINGVSKGSSMPFTVDEKGNSVLSSEWVEPIQALYSTILDRTQQQVATVEESTKPVEKSTKPVTETIEPVAEITEPVTETIEPVATPTDATPTEPVEMVTEPVAEEREETTLTQEKLDYIEKIASIINRHIESNQPATEVAVEQN